MSPFADRRACIAALVLAPAVAGERAADALSHGSHIEHYPQAKQLDYAALLPNPIIAGATMSPHALLPQPVTAPSKG